MLVVTTETIPGKDFTVIGMVKGSTVQTVNAFRDIGASFKTIVGGEIKKYNEMVANARDLATKRMIDEAQAQGAAEVMVYGTAVKFI